MYTPPYGDFFVWLAKRDSSEQPLEPLAFEEADLVTFATMGPDIGNAPYAVTIERDQNTNLQYQSISCMATYSYYSFEELRFCDYSRGRKVAEEVPYIEGPQPSSWLTPTQPSEGLAGLAYSATPSPTAYSNTNSWRQSGGGKKNKRR
ncbi:hypothetical protein BDN72DRAFT_843331 [Pluteus cervinus]|uniref:Uncharacterized protein n=1 Tax=Pluteus cervinus TaxID=181527 RepID=A0ACD3AP18_9AGAR|nr:hypothetical protein BDN72DRAFT_843331 [Pluteus cervinus]